MKNPFKRMLQNSGITQMKVAERHGCRQCTVNIWLNGGASSKPLEATVTKMLSEKQKQQTIKE